MRALIISILSVAVIIASWGIFVNYSDKSIHEMTNAIEDEILISVYAEDWTNAQAQFDEFSKKWHKEKKIYSFFYSTVSLNETDYSIARAKNYIYSENIALSSGELSCIKEQLGFLHLNELISLDNLF